MCFFSKGLPLQHHFFPSLYVVRKFSCREVFSFLRTPVRNERRAYRVRTFDLSTSSVDQGNENCWQVHLACNERV
jgi:hypothetical protein